MCEQSLEEMGAVFEDSNVYVLHMMYQAMGVCIYMQDADGALRYGEKVARYYRYEERITKPDVFLFAPLWYEGPKVSKS